MPKVRHFNSRTAVSLLLVCCFLLSCIGFHSSAEDDIPLMPVKHVFESKDLTAFAAGAKADGEAVTAGDEGYFTLVYSEKTKVDGSIKEWDDGYTSSQRVNFGGKMTAKYHYVAFATQMPGAKVTVWWVEGGDDGRQISVTDASGKEVFRTEATVAKNMPCRSVFILDEPGEYHLG
ncbi:MAG: hypothetical protein CW338_11075, partial [Clostridiales bacterium]|nr:hypothetical protein [Clostridiales bacterium]